MAKVLLVEDDNNLREIYQARLQAEGYDIATARDGEEALVVAKQELPDLVISDVMMPKISGFEMLDILRNTEGLQAVKVIMLTALGQSEDQSRADNLGADRYLVKSQVTLEDIVNAAHELLTEAGAEEAAPAAAPAAVEATTPNPVAPAQEAAPEPVAAPVATQIPVSAPPVIPLAAAPPELPEEMNPVAISMPPTPVSTIPTDDLSDVPAGDPVTTASDAITDPATSVPVEPVTSPDTPDDTQTSQQELDTVQSQIDDFVSNQTGEPEPEVSVEAPAEPLATDATPEVETAPVAAQPTPEQEQALNDAVESLSVEAPAAEATPAPAPVSKKVIEPLTPASDGNNLDQLLAAEEAKEAAAAQDITANPELAPAPMPQDVTPPPTAAPAPEVKPEAAPAPTEPIAPTAEPEAASAPEEPAKPAQNAKQPVANDEFDPNSIAL